MPKSHVSSTRWGKLLSVGDHIILAKQDRPLGKTAFLAKMSQRTSELNVRTLIGIRLKPMSISVSLRTLILASIFIRLGMAINMEANSANMLLRK